MQGRELLRCVLGEGTQWRWQWNEELSLCQVANSHDPHLVLEDPIDRYVWVRSKDYLVCAVYRSLATGKRKGRESFKTLDYSHGNTRSGVWLVTPNVVN